MKKNTACPNCKGKGYNTVMTGKRDDYCGVMNEMCPECNGTGVKLADMTNADRIRAMSDEELAKYITDRTQYQPSPGSRKSYCGAHGNSYMEYHEAALDWLYWLQQPAEEG